MGFTFQDHSGELSSHIPQMQGRNASLEQRTVYSPDGKRPAFGR